MQTKMVVIVVFLALFSVGGYFILRSKQNTYPTSSNGTVQKVPAISGNGVDEMIVEGEEEESSVREVTVEGSEFSFSPKSLSFNKGEKIRLVFKNIGQFPHSLVIGELGVSTATIPSGSLDIVEFTTNQSGTFSFYCSVGNHRLQGMEGMVNIQ